MALSGLTLIGGAGLVVVVVGWGCVVGRFDTGGTRRGVGGLETRDLLGFHVQPLSLCSPQSLVESVLCTPTMESKGRQ